ncbi:MAG: HAD-IA family hydrolase [Muribaculaceae bacterium]|nr:HAD-IA family hydrolase [Muribaculaceae bacterium]
MNCSILPYSNEIRRYLERNGYRRCDPRAALIDMDGTLYDSMVNHTAAWHRLMTEVGIPCTREEFYLYEGRTGADTINELFKRGKGREATQEEKTRLYQLKTEYFRELPPVNRMPGALEMVTTLRKMGLKRVIVTGSGQRSLIDRLTADFPGLFSEDLMITSRDVTHGKPDPEPYLKGMELAGVKPWQAIVVENAPLGIEAGARSGAFTIGVTTGPIPADEMWRAGADVVFRSMESFATRVSLLLSSMMMIKND